MQFIISLTAGELNLKNSDMKAPWYQSHHNQR